MTIRLPKDQYEKLRREAFERRVPMTTLISAALTAYLEGDQS